jgi:GGDEF domain-containing protein
VRRRLVRSDMVRVQCSDRPAIFQPGHLGQNTLVQGTSFAIVGLLIASLRAGLIRERGLSRTDPLTALTNRRGFYEDAGRILARCRQAGRPITVAYLGAT